jgi:cysteine synthase
MEELEKKLKDGKMYIAKPSAGSQGDGIAIITKIKDIPMTIYNQ